MGGFVTGVLGLSLLGALAASDSADTRIGGVFTTASRIVRHLASPDVPAIPDLRLATIPGPPRGAGRANKPASTSRLPRPSRRLPVAT